jgi:hypothetical protein
MARLARPRKRRALTVFIAGLIAAAVFLPFVTWGLALAGGWLTFLLAAWPVIIRADSSHAPQLAAAKTRPKALPGCCWPG